MANVTVKVDLSGLRRKLSASQFSRAKNVMANQVLLNMDQFVPRSGSAGGYLRASGHVNSQGNIEYGMIYARAQFYGFVTARDGSQHRVHKYTTPGTSRRWDLRASAHYGEVWAQALVRGLALGR
jgi:hypothetical protein